VVRDEVPNVLSFEVLDGILLQDERDLIGVGDSSPHPSGIRETRGSIPGLAFSFLLPQISVPRSRVLPRGSG